MENFNFCVGVNVLFGKDQVENLPSLLAPYEKKVLLCYGRGSVIDCAKAVAAAVYYDGDPWEMISLQKPSEKALPIVTILTLAAAGSEADNGAVISNPETNEKLGLGAPVLI